MPQYILKESDNRIFLMLYLSFGLFLPRTINWLQHSKTSIVLIKDKNQSVFEPYSTTKQLQNVLGKISNYLFSHLCSQGSRQCFFSTNNAVICRIHTAADFRRVCVCRCIIKLSHYHKCTSERCFLHLASRCYLSSLCVSF